MSAPDKIIQTNAGSAGTLDGAPSAATDGNWCSGYRYATFIAQVTADSASDVATFEVWLGYKTNATTAKPETIVWVKDTRIPGGNYSAIKGTAGDTAKVDLEIAGADKVYHRWSAQTDADVRVKAYVKLHNPAVSKY